MLSGFEHEKSFITSRHGLIDSIIVPCGSLQHLAKTYTYSPFRFTKLKAQSFITYAQSGLDMLSSHIRQYMYKNSHDGSNLLQELSYSLK